MSSSERRIAANRANALRATGPRTAAGKGAARGNALKHGMTAVVVVPAGEAGEAGRRIDRLQRQLAPDGDELGSILARHAALLSLQVERCARHEEALAAERVRTAEADHDDARRAEAEHLFHYSGAEGPTNHRRLLATPEGVDLLVDQMEALARVGRPGGAPWDGSHSSAFDHLTGRRYYMPVSRMTALGDLIDRDDASGLDPAEVPAGDRAARRAWAQAEASKLVDAELARLRALRAAFDPATAADARARAVDRATVVADEATLLTRKYLFAAHRAMPRTLDEVRRLRRDEARRADPVAKAELRARVAREEPNPRALPPALGSFLPDALAPLPSADASTFANGKPPPPPSPTPRPPPSRPATPPDPRPPINPAACHPARPARPRPRCAPIPVGGPSVVLRGRPPAPASPAVWPGRFSGSGLKSRAIVARGRFGQGGRLG